MEPRNTMPGGTDNHPSLDASLEDFEDNGSMHAPIPLSLPLCPLPPSDQSDFLETSSNLSSRRSDMEEVEPWRPPYARNLSSYRTAPLGSSSRIPFTHPTQQLRDDSPRPFKRSRTSSPVQTESSYNAGAGDDEDLTLQATRRLRSDEQTADQCTSKSSASLGTAGPDNPHPTNPGKSPDGLSIGPELSLLSPPHHLSFALSGEFKDSSNVVHNLLACLQYLRSRPIFTLTLLLMAASSRFLFSSDKMTLNLPNLHMATRLTESFEPMIFYSTQGQYHVLELQDSSGAVWDLGERVRVTNMTSAPTLVKELDGLSEDLKSLTLEMTNFFTTVNGDIDNILNTMEWAKSRLEQLHKDTGNPIAILWDNVHTLGTRFGVLADRESGEHTSLGAAFHQVFGTPSTIHRQVEIHRLFNHYLNALEEGINNELVYSAAIQMLFHTVDQRFQNIVRVISRESDQQEREEGQMLGSLWTKLMGPSSTSLKKFERNKDLLQMLRGRTISNKEHIIGHRLKLITMKSGLEDLRKRLVSPLIRANDTNFDGIPTQINTLDRTYNHISALRSESKTSMMYLMYDVRSKASAKEMRNLQNPHLSGPSSQAIGGSQT